MKRVLVVFGAVALAIFLGCGKSDDGSGAPKPNAGSVAPTKSESASKTEEPVETKSAKEWDPAKGTATVAGFVKFVGKAPKRRKIDMGGKPECAAQQSEELLDETIIVNPDSSLKNVFVYVRKGLEEWTFRVPAEPVELNQKGCMFHPHVVGLRVGQQLKVKNSDTCSHNVRSTPGSARNAPFNFMQTRQGQEDLRTFSTRDVFVRIGCDVHGWMRSNIGVVDNPYFAITGDNGKFELKNLPKGEFTIEAVHEDLGKKSQSIKLGDKDTKEINFEFSRQ